MGTAGPTSLGGGDRDGELQALPRRERREEVAVILGGPPVHRAGCGRVVDIVRVVV